jgi:hypothetical protein
MIINAPRIVPNAVILRDHQTPTVKEEIRRFGSQYGSRLSADPNDLAVNLMLNPTTTGDYEDLCYTICLPDFDYNYCNYRF